MCIQIKLEVSSELVRKVKSYDSHSLEVLCDQEIKNRIEYLETVVKAWKTYRKVENEQRHTLFLLLLSGNKDALHDYEKLVLYAKMIENDQNEHVGDVSIAANQAKITDRESTTSTIELGAESDCSTVAESDSFSPIPHQYNGGNQTSQCGNVISTEISKKLVEKSAISSHKNSDSIVQAEFPEDETVMGAYNNSDLSNKIAFTASQLKNVLDDAEVLKTFRYEEISESLEKLKCSAANMGIKQIEKTMSKGKKKRAKKAERKASEVANAHKKWLEQKSGSSRQAELAANALRLLQEHNTLPMTEHSKKVSGGLSASVGTNFYGNCKESIRSRVEEKYNQLFIDRIRELTEKLEWSSESPEKNRQFTKTDELTVVKAHIVRKLDYWKKSTQPQAAHYTEMYQLLFEKCGPSISDVIMNYMRYDTLPEAEFEQTLLLQYQSGKLFEKDESSS